MKIVCSATNLSTKRMALPTLSTPYHRQIMLPLLVKYGPIDAGSDAINELQLYGTAKKCNDVTYRQEMKS